MPLGKRAVAMAMWPLRTSVKRSRISSRRLADGDRARDVGRAVEILRAASRPGTARPARSLRLVASVTR